MKATSSASAASAPHLADATGSSSTAIRISMTGSAIPATFEEDSGTPNDRMADWEPARSSSFAMPETTNTAARTRRARSNSPSIRSNPLHDVERTDLARKPTVILHWDNADDPAVYHRVSAPLRR